jgi:hypothetical protein
VHQWRILDWSGSVNPNQQFGSIDNPNWLSGMFSLFVGSGFDAGDVFLKFTPTTSAVPEPSTVVLVLVGGLLSAAYLRNRSTFL